jgi:hypothetical protein
MTGDQDIFDSEVPEAPQTTEGVSPEAPSRDDRGRFAAKDQGEAAPADEPSAEGAPPAPAERAVRDVPLSALLDERDKRKALEARLAQIEQQQQPQQQWPDPIDDAEGYTRAVQQQAAIEAHTRHLQMARALAVREYGAELVEQAYAYFDQPQNRPQTHVFAREALSFHAMVEAFKERKTAEERSSPDYEARLREKLRAELLAEMGAASPSSARPIPRSLASATGSGSQPPPGSSDPLFS